jgi:membrane protein
MMSVAGFGMLLIGAGGFFGQLQDALNTVWSVGSQRSHGWKEMLRDRFLSFLMVLGTGFLLFTSMILTSLLQAVSHYGERIAHTPPQIWETTGTLISFVLITLLFAAIFKILPDTRVRWRDVWIGAMFTAALFVAGKFAMGRYLGSVATASGYGSAGSLSIVLIWVYYSSIILLFGAEFTQVLATRSGQGPPINVRPTAT